MKVICCGCGVDLGEKPSDPTHDDLVSHGYCDTCAHHFLAQIGMSLPEYLEGIDVPVVAVTRERTVSFANSSAQALLGKTLAQIQGHLGGEVFECEYALLPEGCGNAVHCSGCTIKNTVLDTIKTGNHHERVPATLKQHDGSGSHDLDLLISTEKKGGVVFLRIDTIREMAPTNDSTLSTEGAPSVDK